jgi:hypothetical protein
MLPITVTHFVFYKYPGGIPVKGGSGGSPRILPVEVKLHEHRLCAYVTPCERCIRNNNVIGKKGAGNTQQRTEQQGSYGGIGLHGLGEVKQKTQSVYNDV